MIRRLHIGFGQDSDELILSFRLRDTDLARRWQQKVRAAQRLQYPIDDVERFYGFNGLRQEQERALTHINHQIDTINQHSVIIDRRMRHIDDQDTLNYLHNIFERYHGLLDQQHDNAFWQSAPDTVRTALATLNTAVHRCESAARGCNPRTVVTYYGLPKKHTFEPQDYELIERDWRFGTVHICYVEIGKTLLDLSQDNDAYIGDDAFRPYTFYSADFVVQFNDSDAEKNQLTEQAMWNYYDRHRDFFESRGYHRDHPALQMGVFPVADLDSSLDADRIIHHLRSRQRVNRVWFSWQSDPAELHVYGATGFKSVPGHHGGSAILGLRERRAIDIGIQA